MSIGMLLKGKAFYKFQKSKKQISKDENDVVFIRLEFVFWDLKFQTNV